MIDIERETASDAAAIRAVLEDAFETPAEADLVDRLRAEGDLACSFVAREDGRVVGCVQGSAVRLEPEAPLRGIGLAPVAVLTERQGRGIGGALCERFVAFAREVGFDFAVVLGSPAYYPRFGFRTSTELGLRSTYDVRPEVFMAMALCELPPLDAVVHYLPAFEGV